MKLKQPAEKTKGKVAAPKSTKKDIEDGCDGHTVEGEELCRRGEIQK